MQTCLWLARVMPFPQTAGDRIYSVKLAGALAASGVDVTFAALAGDAPPEPVEGIVWHVVPGVPFSQRRALLSTMPLVAARFAIPEYKSELTRLAGSRAWDIVVLDHYSMGWVLSYRRLFGTRAPVFVYVTHDHVETVTYRQCADATIGVAKRAYLTQNYLKTRRFERATAHDCDLLTAITEDDARTFERNDPTIRSLVLSPGYDGPRVAQRVVDASVPRAAVLFGSYRWSAKQANLRLFMDQAGGGLTDAGIDLRIVGDMADDFRAEMQARYPAAIFTGFVRDPAPYLDARVALVAEPIGGGFKMKLLEYIFRRLPILALEACAAGLPDSVRRHMLIYPNLASLGAGVVEVIDNTALLDRLQRGAFDAANDLFEWSRRAEALRDGIALVQGRRVTPSDPLIAFAPLEADAVGPGS